MVDYGLEADEAREIDARVAIAHQLHSGRRPECFYRGVKYNPALRKWIAEIRKPGGKGDRIFLGNFDIQEDAARANDIAARDARGAKADTNFAPCLSCGAKIRGAARKGTRTRPAYNKPKKCPACLHGKSKVNLGTNSSLPNCSSASLFEPAVHLVVPKLTREVSLQLSMPRRKLCRGRLRWPWTQQGDLGRDCGDINLELRLGYY